jgi:hypothetical protein
MKYLYNTDKRKEAQEPGSVRESNSGRLLESRHFKLGSPREGYWSSSPGEGITNDPSGRQNGILRVIFLVLSPSTGGFPITNFQDPCIYWTNNFG